MNNKIPSDQDLLELAASVGAQLKQGACTLTTAESCTGGWAAKLMTDHAGSSAWFERGFVTYTNISKQELLGVDAQILQDHGAVSEAVVRSMAQGALEHSPAAISLAISGIAGPGGGAEDRPVGLVWFAWARQQGPHQDGNSEYAGACLCSEQKIFSGDRDAIRRQAVAHALMGVTRCLGGG
ncbi:MAG: nicotinamide-nucleotide amidohydrolase family protein [Gammaproteobacteria bacterium]|nr:nicotinamide-nucleotide amidohydrolase family protein [Gammaproteobacteria bacterium]